MEASSEEIGQVAFKDGLKDVAYGSVSTPLLPVSPFYLSFLLLPLPTLYPTYLRMPHDV